MIADCTPYLDLLIESLDEALPVAVQQDLEAHLASCASCVEALRAHVRVRSTLRDLGSADVEPLLPLPEALVRRFVAAIRAAREGGARGDVAGDARIA